MNSIEILTSQERFLPFRPSQILDHLLRDSRLALNEREHLKMLAARITSRFHIEFYRRTERLKEIYDPFDPDRDTLAEEALSEVPLERQRAQLCLAFRKLLLESNYLELPRRQIVDCVELQNFGGLKVEANLDDYKDLAVFYRGAERHERNFRKWRQMFRKQAKTCTIFRRAAVLVRTVEQPERIHLKLFKNIVAEDLEMVLPRVRVRMRLVDGLKIGSSLAGSVATAGWKAIAAAFSPWLFMTMLGTFLGAMIRAVFSYMASKTRYMQLLSSNLYFQNLANNASVLAHLVDSAEAEESKEMLLAYFMLYVERDRDYTLEDLGRRIHQWVRDEFSLEVDFEVRNAVQKLIDGGLVVDRSPVGEPGSAGEPNSADTPTVGSAVSLDSRRILKVYDLPSALRRLDKAWDGLCPHGPSLPPGIDRVAEGERPGEAARRDG